MPKVDQPLLKLRQLEAFLSAARHGNFGKASEELGVSGSALSSTIGELEADLGQGVKLFERNQRGARLTKQGEAFVAFAERILEEAEAGRRAVQAFSDGTGALQVSYVASVARYVLPAIQAAAEKTPRLYVTAREVESDRVYLHVSRGSAELGVTFFPPAGYAPEGCELDEIRTGTFWCVTAPDHRLAGWKSITPADLENERLAIPWVHALDERSWLGAAFLSYSQANRVRRQWPEVQANSIGAVLAMVKQGQVVGVMPTLDLEDRKGVTLIPLDPEPPPVQLGIVWKRGQPRSAVGEAFATDVRERIKRGFDGAA